MGLAETSKRHTSASSVEITAQIIIYCVLLVRTMCAALCDFYSLILCAPSQARTATKVLAHSRFYCQHIRYWRTASSVLHSCTAADHHHHRHHGHSYRMMVGSPIHDMTCENMHGLFSFILLWFLCLDQPQSECYTCSEYLCVSAYFSRSPCLVLYVCSCRHPLRFSLVTSRSHRIPG